MISKDELDLFSSIKEVTDMGQWDIKKKYGWMPQTQHSSAIFNHDGLSVERCWQKAGNMAQASILYFRVNLSGRELRKPLSFMLEADDCFYLFHLLYDIQSNGIEVVDTQARKKHYGHYLRKDANHLLYEAAVYLDKMDRYLEQMKRWGQQEEQFADGCTAAYEAQVNAVELFSACWGERTAADATIRHHFTVSHTPMQKPGIPKIRPFRIQLQASRENGSSKMKTVHLDLTEEKFTEFVDTLWEAYKLWWRGE